MTMELRHPLVRSRGSRFERLAAWSYHRRWRALAAWVVVLAGVTVASQLVGDDYRNDFSLPGTESQRAVDTLKGHAPAQAGSTVQIVLHHPGGIRAPQTQQRVEAMLEGVRRLPHVTDVVGPYADPSAISPDGTIAYATVALNGRLGLVPLTIPEVRRLLVALVWTRPVEPGLVLAWSRWRRRHQARARRAHYQRRESMWDRGVRPCP